MRALLLAVACVLAVTTVSAQHKIPPLPDTAGAPVTLASGITVVDIKPGIGVTAEKGRLVRINYTGWVTKTEIMFDFRNDRTGALAFHLGEGGPLKGLELGVYGMRVGGKRRVIVPPHLGFGAHARTSVPAGSELTFDVELVGVAKPGV